MKLLVDKGANVNAADAQGRSVLHVAAGSGNADYVKLLLAKNVRVNVRERGNAMMPLHIACMRGDVKSAYYLIRAGAEIDSTDASRRTAMHWAAQNGHGRVVRLLIAAGASSVVRDNEGHTPEDVARLNVNDDIASIIRYRRARPR